MSLKEKFENHYKGYKDDELSKAVEEFFEDPINVKHAEDLNKLGIPPAFTFIFMTQEKNSALFSRYLDGDADYHSYFGKLFGAVFYDLGYSSDKTVHNNAAFLKSASVFEKTIEIMLFA